jgi:glycosyltransferase involved in cell wall biosynthesis
MRLVFASSYHYPAHPAQFKHGLTMARAYAELLGARSLYFALFDKDGTLADIPHVTFLHPKLRKLRRIKLLTLYLFLRYAAFFLTHPGWQRSVIISQESKLIFLFLLLRPFFGFRIIYECHGLHSALTDRFVCEKSDAVVFVTKKSEDEARAKWKLRESHVFPNAVDLPLFEDAKRHGRAGLRRLLGLPEEVTLVGYVGRFFAMNEDKGIEAGLRALARIADTSVSFCFVGGTKEEIALFEGKARELGVFDRAIFVPYQKESRRVAEYTAAMDVLMYAPPPVKFFMEETSPMKLYEYMAAGKPIVVSDFPALREMLSDDEAYFFSGDGLHDAVMRSISDADAAARAARAYARVKDNSWTARARRIIAVAEQLV